MLRLLQAAVKNGLVINPQYPSVFHMEVKHTTVQFILENREESQERFSFEHREETIRDLVFGTELVDKAVGNKWCCASISGYSAGCCKVCLRTAQPELDIEDYRKLSVEDRREYNRLGEKDGNGNCITNDCYIYREGLVTVADYHLRKMAEPEIARDINILKKYIEGISL